MTDKKDAMNLNRGAICNLNPEEGGWTCRAYKRVQLKDDIDRAQETGLSKKDSVLDSLRKNNVTFYIVTQGSANIMKDIRSIIAIAAKENVSIALSDPDVMLRCCLFEDEHGRLYNLVISDYSVGPVTEWTALLQTFSGIQAMIAATILCRSFPCAFAKNIGQLQPALLSLILGLVFKEEVSLSWLNSSMMVRCLPSVSAHTLTAELGSDWLRKIATLLLALAGATTGDLQRYMTIIGIFLFGAILLANLGARAWRFMKWLPIHYTGPFSLTFAYLTSIITGILFPFMGCREIEAGGKPAVESVMISALVVAAVFVLSDIDAIQSFVVLGSETCPQNEVNLIVGIWWTLTAVSSLFMILRIKSPVQTPAGEEHLLIPAQESPVGFKVPDIPDYIVDPNLARKGIQWLSLAVELSFGIVLSLAVGAAIIYWNYAAV